ncbi:MAG: right-handed parallel beta-helix repeat-containing protein [Armatimonadota bacterium]|nr:right-handed parallel beta-helix repeat-containing protein [Armatimonadota bacterium]
MSKFSCSRNVLAVAAMTLLWTSFAQAQATRTWVSGVGDDVNPCSRTAPCKTFAGAISKTAAGGEINTIDAGAFGTLTITKAITVDGRGLMAGVLASGTTGFIVNAGPSDVVVLRNLQINGGTPVSPGIIGIRILAAKTVIIENCNIFKFRAAAGTNPGRAISDERTAAGSKLFVINCTINDNSSNAVVIAPAAGTSGVSATLDNVRIYDNGLTGLFAGLGAKVTIRNSVINSNGNAGVHSSDNNTEVNIENCVISHNTQFGVFSGPGTATIRLSNAFISKNNVGISTNGGAVISFKNNRINGNTTNGAPTLQLDEQ